jgi:hypothetical protein
MDEILKERLRHGHVGETMKGLAKISERFSGDAAAPRSRVHESLTLDRGSCGRTHKMVPAGHCGGSGTLDEPVEGPTGGPGFRSTEDPDVLD